MPITTSGNGQMFLCHWAVVVGINTFHAVIAHCKGFLHITLISFITMLCGTDNILRDICGTFLNIPH
jgi:hypothetical protein